MIRSRIFPVVVLVLLLTGCGGHHPPAPVTVPGKSLDKPPAVYRVNPGDSLYSIAWRYSLDATRIAAWNDLGPPYTIHVDQRLRLTAPPPGSKPRVVTRPLKKYTPPADTGTRQTQVNRVERKPARKTISKGAPTWRWPVQGKRSTKQDRARDNLKIPGTLDEPVLAAAAGQVVYVGSGLRGYGKLIIVKHNNNYLSAYGHNRKVLVSEHDQVSASQKIATMGQTDAERPMLHFEIRRNGKPVPPLSLLPGS